MFREPCVHGRYEAHRLPPVEEPLSVANWCGGGRPLTDAELASLGYVKANEFYSPEVLEAWARYGGYVRLDGIDVEALRDELRYASDAAEHSPVVRLGLAFLAAIDREDTP